MKISFYANCTPYSYGFTKPTIRPSVNRTIYIIQNRNKRQEDKKLIKFTTEKIYMNKIQNKFQLKVFS